MGTNRYTTYPGAQDHDRGAAVLSLPAHLASSAGQSESGSLREVQEPVLGHAQAREEGQKPTAPGVFLASAAFGVILSGMRDHPRAARDGTCQVSTGPRVSMKVSVRTVTGAGSVGRTAEPGPSALVRPAGPGSGGVSYVRRLAA